LNTAGVDVGRSNVKVYHSNGFFSFSSRLGEGRDFEFLDEVGKDDIFGEYNGRRFTAGSLIRESDFGSSLMIPSKIHEDTVILTLIALFKAFKSSEIGLVTNLPIKHPSERQRTFKKASRWLKRDYYKRRNKNL
jgi:plasmid segregation protein ParM